MIISVRPPSFDFCLWGVPDICLTSALSFDSIETKNPDSATIEILDYRAGDIRPPVTENLVKAIRLTDQLDAYAVTSTCMVCRDIPETIADLYRLYWDGAD